ncbi:laccase-4 [Crucibulum laeve]|uniref:Laccase-4 n=1 Tax=Crucibulum laeve TaxID=68775 RepID=A0A5C3LXF3_9AGAR|nr:laccase-4 [Crucibulum laeve]
MAFLPALTQYLTLLTLFCRLVLAADVNYQFNVVNANIFPDGFTRSAVLVNGAFPGTLIQAQKTDTLHITVNDQLTDPSMRRSTSVHWHGLFQFRTASEDGRNMYFIPSSIDDTNSIIVPLNGQAGTFCMNNLDSHLSSQYVDGLRGPMVVYDPSDPHLSLYDEDNANTVITLADWYHQPAPGLQATYLQGNHEPIPDSGVINGIGRYDGGPSVLRPRINVVSGKKYRFRVINISAYSGFIFSIESHSLSIIEVDGINHRPLTVGGLAIYAGQRYSVVLNANQPIRNYWVRAPMELQHSNNNLTCPTVDTENVYAVLHYQGASSSEPTTKAKVSASNLLQEHLLVPLENPGAPGGSQPADHVIDLQFTRDVNAGKLEWTVNNIRYEPPTLPTLLNIIANNFTVESDFSVHEHTLVLSPNEIVELHIHGSANGSSSSQFYVTSNTNIYLHGHAFDVVQASTGPPNYVNPPRRDVVGVKGSTVIIRFKADNPGPWFLHCRKCGSPFYTPDWHLEAGLAVVFAESPAQQRTGPQAQIIKQEWLDLCPIYQALPLSQQ